MHADDLENQRALTLAREADPLGERTIGNTSCLQSDAFLWRPLIRRCTHEAGRSWKGLEVPRTLAGGHRRTQ